MEVPRSGVLAGVLSKVPPSHLYHYTGPAGAIGILTSRTLWAGRPSDMNDSTEQLLGRKYAIEKMHEYLGQYALHSFGQNMADYSIELLSTGPWRRGRTESRIFTVSLTPQRDSLEQWRAYCPRSGGVALGFPTQHLIAVAAEQRFTLAPCVYDQSTQRAIVDEVVALHVQKWADRFPLDASMKGMSGDMVRAFVAEVDQVSPLLKHHTFAAEQEWRLLSPLVQGSDGALIHVPSETGIKLFRPFKLLTDEHPRMARFEEGSFPGPRTFHAVMGPNVDPSGMSEAIRTLVPPEFGYQYDVTRTATPYR